VRSPEDIQAEEHQRGRNLVQALCCECGHLFERWRSPKYTEPRPLHRESDFDRNTFTAKCDACGTRTVHAKIRNDEHRNHTEEWQNLVCRIGQIADAQRRTWRYFDPPTDTAVRTNAEYSWWRTVECDVVGHVISADALAEFDPKKMPRLQR
jgi:hypothetical protein